VPPRNPPFVSEVTLDRRTVLQWLGRSAVLALGADLLAACTDKGGAALPPVTDAGDDAPLAQVTCDADAGTVPAFAPGTLGPGLPPWPVRTVDPPELQALLAGWRLTVDGLCAAPQTFTFADLMCLPRQDQVMDFHCVEGWDVLDVPWNGVHMQRLFDLVQPTAAATYVTFHTWGDFYNESLPLGVALEPHTMLGYGVGGNTLPVEHGFPLRVVIPRLLGYKNAKYVERIELTDAPISGFWVDSGYPYAGEVPAGRLREGKY
jgi:DMSO/TMAO reductase YedYZ molybdopterin-dependent catalytic subunit